MLFSTWPLKYLPSFSFQKNAHISPVDLRNAGRVLIWQVMLLWQEGYTPVLTHVLSHSYTNTHKTYLFAAKKITLQMLSSNWGSWESVQRKKNEPEWPSSQERNVILHPSVGFVFPLTLSKEVLPHRRGTHEKLCRAILDLADCVDGLHGCIELWSCDAFLCFIVPIIRCTGTHTHTHMQPFLISFLVRYTQTFMNFG